MRKNITPLPEGFAPPYLIRFYINDHGECNKIFGIYLCGCGNTFKARVNDVKKEDTRSCGCFKKLYLRAKLTKHGYKHTRIYNILIKIRQRCNNPNNKDYNLYGGRGINICNEWNNDYISFFDWAFNNGYENHLTIDRINNNGNYEPSNCRWVTMKEQNRNRRSNIILEYDGVKMCLSDWAKHKGIRQQTLSKRIKSGWSVDEALTAPKNSKYHKRK